MILILLAGFTFPAFHDAARETAFRLCPLSLSLIFFFFLSMILGENLVASPRKKGKCIACQAREPRRLFFKASLHSVTETFEHTPLAISPSTSTEQALPPKPTTAKAKEPSTGSLPSSDVRPSGEDDGLSSARITFISLTHRGCVCVSEDNAVRPPPPLVFGATDCVVRVCVSRRPLRVETSNSVGQHTAN